MKIHGASFTINLRINPTVKKSTELSLTQYFQKLFKQTFLLPRTPLSMPLNQEFHCTRFGKCKESQKSKALLIILGQPPGSSPLPFQPNLVPTLIQSHLALPHLLLLLASYHPPLLALFPKSS